MQKKRLFRLINKKWQKAIEDDQAYNERLVRLIQITFLILIIFILFLGSFAFYETRRINHEMEQLNQKYLTSAEVSASLLAKTYYMGIKFREYLSGAANLEEVITNSRSIFNFLLRTQYQVTDSSTIIQGTREYDKLLQEYLLILTRLQKTKPEDQQQLVEEILFLEEGMSKVANDIVLQAWDLTNTQMTKTEQLTQNTKGAILFSAILAFFAGLAIEFVILLFATWLVRKQNQLVINLKREAEMEANLRKMEVSALEAQVNPHFIFNTLNTISAIATLEGATSVPEVTGALGDLLRYSLGRNNKVTLADEALCAKQYIFIQQKRFGQRLRASFQIEHALQSFPLPRMTLQPLIENAVKHGLEPKKEGGVIKVEAFLQGEWVVILVKDDGVGISPQLLERLNNQSPEEEQEGGIGIVNVRKRLRHFYPSASLTLESDQNGTTLRLILPFNKEWS